MNVSCNYGYGYGYGYGLGNGLCGYEYSLFDYIISHPFISIMPFLDLCSYSDVDGDVTVVGHSVPVFPQYWFLFEQATVLISQQLGAQCPFSIASNSRKNIRSTLTVLTGNWLNWLKNQIYLFSLIIKKVSILFV